MPQFRVHNSVFAYNSSRTDSIHLFELAADGINISAGGMELDMVQATVSAAKDAATRPRQGATATRKADWSMARAECLRHAREVIE